MARTPPVTPTSPTPERRARHDVGGLAGRRRAHHWRRRPNVGKGKVLTFDVERFRAEDFLRSDAASGASTQVSRVRVLERQLSSVPVHWHDYYEFCYVRDGSAKHVLNGTAERVQRGSAFLLSPADFHEIVVDSGRLSCINVVVDPFVIEGLLDAVLRESDQLPWNVHDFTGIDYDVERLCHDSLENSVASAMAVKGRLFCIIAGLARLTQRNGEPDGPARPDTSSEIRRAIRYVDRHFRSRLRLADVAAVAHLSPNYFSERFSEATGISFQAYLKERRLQFARSVLGATSLTVTEVSRAAGFNDVSYFGRVYRERFGDAPSHHSIAAPVPRDGHGLALKGLARQ